MGCALRLEDSHPDKKVKEGLGEVLSRLGDKDKGAVND
jgi:hypothetical protein